MVFSLPPSTPLSRLLKTETPHSQILEGKLCIEKSCLLHHLSQNDSQLRSKNNCTLTLLPRLQNITKNLFCRAISPTPTPIISSASIVGASGERGLGALPTDAGGTVLIASWLIVVLKETNLLQWNLQHAHRLALHNKQTHKQTNELQSRLLSKSVFFCFFLVPESGMGYFGSIIWFQNWTCVLE